MLTRLLQFELRYSFKRVSTLLFLIGFVGYGILSMTSGFQFLGNSSMYNDAYNLTLMSGLISLGSLIPCLYYVISGVLRDQNYHTEELIFSTGITKINYFLSRFSSVFIFSLSLATLSFIGVLLGTILTNVDPTTINTFERAHYLRPWLTTIVPNTFIISAILFSFAILGRRPIWAYLGAFVIAGLYWWSAQLINSPLIGGSSLSDPRTVAWASYIDLFGMSPFFDQTQFLTPLEKKDFLISIDGTFLYNRILWLSVSLISLLIANRFLSFRKLSSSSKKPILESLEIAHVSKYRTAKSDTQSFGMRLMAITSLIKVDIKAIVKTIPFLIIVIIWIVLLLFSFDYSTTRTSVYGSRYPTTDLLLSLILEVLPSLGIFLIVYYSGELVWHSRKYKMMEIFDASPISNFSYLVAKLLALITLPIILIAVAILTGLVFQISHGYYDFDFMHYLSSFYYGGFQLLLYAIFCLLVQLLISNKYLGMLVSVLLIFLFGSMSEYIGLTHPLLQFNQLPNMARAYSDFSNYGLYASIFNWYALLWSVSSLSLLLLSYKFWRRGISLRPNLFKNWAFFEKTTMLIIVLLFSCMLMFLFYKLNIENSHHSQAEHYDLKEQYELSYKKFESTPILSYTSVNAIMDIFPDEQKYSVQVEAIITNKSSLPINELLISSPTDLTDIDIEGAHQVSYDAASRTYLYQLENTLQPNQSSLIQYRAEVCSSPFDLNHAISKNGSYIKSTHFTPFLGYNSDYEIKDAFVRKQRGLPELDSNDNQASNTDVHAKYNYENIDFTTTISTSKDQVAFSSGTLLKSWKDENRNYYQFKSSEKIDHLAAYFSADYKVETIEHRGIKVEVFHLPEHYRNVSEMLKVTKATLDYCIDNFGPYPRDYLRIGEIPVASGPNGQAMPGVISVNEKIFKNDIEDPSSFNVVARVLIHEISHQWWGLLLTPKRIEGALWLTESLAKYTESVVLNQLYGSHMANRLSQHELRRYFSGRSRAREPEPPLYRTARQQYVGYSKGAITMNALKELVGEDQLNRALASLIEEDNGESEVVSLDLLEKLYEVTPELNWTLIDDWVKDVITYELSIEAVTCKQLGKDKSELTLQTKSERHRMNPMGHEDTIPIDELIYIGVYDGPPNKTTSELIYLSAHKCEKDNSEFTLKVDGMAQYIVLDPYYTRIDRNRANNIFYIEHCQ